MDGRSLSGFTNSSYFGTNHALQLPAPAPSPTVVNPQTVKVKSLIDVFTKATDI